MLKTTWNKRKKHNKIVILTISNLNSIESKTSKVLIDNENIHEDFKTIINEENNYLALKESINLMKIQISDTENLIWLKKAKEKTLMKLLDKMYEYKTMLSHCLKFKTYRKHKSKIIFQFPKLFFKTTNGKTMLLLKCAKCGSLKSKLIKRQEGGEILSSLGLKTPLSKILLFGDVFFSNAIP